MSANTHCPSCGCACVARGVSSAIRRVRCGTCGSLIVIDASGDHVDEGRQSNVVVAISRTDESSRSTRTVLLREDGTTELVAGEDGAAVLVVGHAARATVAAWRTLVTSPALANFDRVTRNTNASPDAGASPRYDVRLDGAHHSWRGRPADPAAARVWSMMTGLWGTVEPTPL